MPTDAYGKNGHNLIQIHKSTTVKEPICGALNLPEDFVQINSTEFDPNPTNGLTAKRHHIQTEGQGLQTKRKERLVNEAPHSSACRRSQWQSSFTPPMTAARHSDCNNGMRPEMPH